MILLVEGRVWFSVADVDRSVCVCVCETERERVRERRRTRVDPPGRRGLGTRTWVSAQLEVGTAPSPIHVLTLPGAYLVPLPINL